MKSLKNLCLECENLTETPKEKVFYKKSGWCLKYGSEIWTGNDNKGIISCLGYLKKEAGK